MPADSPPAAQVNFLKRSFFQRLLGRCATREPSNPDCWSYTDGVLSVDLSHTPELLEAGGGVRLEDKTLPERVLILRGNDGRCYAFPNRCGHAGRRLDPVPGTATVQCCSMGKSTYDYSGEVLFGDAKPITPYEVNESDGHLTVKLV